MSVTVAKVGLPIDEVLRIQKTRLTGSAKGEQEAGKRISIVTGVHGDELEGQLVCFEVIRRIKEHPELLTGTVDVYPAMNPLGIDSITRGIPAFDLDMNRLFPGNEDGAMTEYLSAKIMQDLEGSDVCVDIHASNIYLRELPQVRINELHKDMLVPLAKYLNIDFIWVHSASTVLEATLAHSLNSRNTPALVVEMGVGMRLTREYCEQLTEGLFCLMKELGIWQGEVCTPRKPIYSDNPNDVSFLNAEKSGVFVPCKQHSKLVEKGDLIGQIINPLEGTVLEDVTAKVSGLLFTLREYPIVDEGSLLGRIIVHPEVLTNG